MELADLTAYAKSKYDIPEELNWIGFAGLSAMHHPVSKKLIAVLMRQWDTESGTEIQKCDLRCGRMDYRRMRYPYITEPTREKGGDWIGIDFTQQTDQKLVMSLFDVAYNINSPSIATTHAPIVEVQQPNNQKVYTDTPINFANRPKPSKSLYVTPDKITEMKRLYEYSMYNLDEARSKNFYRQGKFMEDFEDDAPATVFCSYYYPTYHDLNILELRAYFTWRTQLRRGNIQPIAPSLAYIYIYELLNGIGATSAEDALAKLQSFEANYLERFGNGNIKNNFRRWMFDFAIINNLPKATALQYAPEELKFEQAIGTMHDQEAHTDDEILAALGVAVKKDFFKSPVIKKQGDKGKKYFAGVCRILKDELANTIFGAQKIVGWKPLNNAIYHPDKNKPDFDYEIFPTLKYKHSSGVWQVQHYDYNYYNQLMLKNFVSAVDLKLRQHFHTGSPLKESEAYRQFYPSIDRAIHQLDEESKPKITVNLQSLSQIREDSATTRDSLLTDEDRDNGVIATATVETLRATSQNGNPNTIVGNNMGNVMGNVMESVVESVANETLHATSLQPTAANTAATNTAAPPNESIEIQILRALLADGDASAIIKANHLMPSIAAEKINEMFYDQFADNIVDCDGAKIWIIDDYKDDIKI